ncbi:MAG: hypothetical protein JO060_04845, partial [Candidatus Eremiobacteraeota bacterium]|nr:hypothetical protein [Candidatus Eremiobacteraeota bacterium]
GYAERVIYAFQNGSDGAFPAPTLAFLNGTLYGATFGGGLYRCRGLYGGCGTVFALTPSGSGYTESILYRFRGGNDGAEPGIVFVSGNVLYGTTVSGFHKHGTVFELLLSKGTARKRLVHGFEGGQDGAMPTGLLKRGGALYGTTFEGGGYSGCFLSYLGCGTVFELARSGDAFTETILHRFSGPDGGNPNTGLIAGNNGVLYGTTQWGGTTCPQGCGTVSNLCRHKTVTSLRRCTYSMHQPLTCRPG